MAFPKFQDQLGSIPWIFQQDNTLIHTAMIKTWISEQNVDLLPWPPYLPFLNIIENVVNVVKQSIRIWTII